MNPVVLEIYQVGLLDGYKESGDGIHGLGHVYFEFQELEYLLDWEVYNILLYDRRYFNPAYIFHLKEDRNFVKYRFILGFSMIGQKEKGKYKADKNPSGAKRPPATDDSMDKSL